MLCNVFDGDIKWAVHSTIGACECNDTVEVYPCKLIADACVSTSKMIVDLEISTNQTIHA